ncbi:MAG: chromate transporter [Bacteroidetes bacterium]|uniref:Chromate transporter n=1 Tax=Candidatus Cryptobacteroides faecipullorum TaxID=2840764 RepID=A0A9D9NBL0_9BACT|nr:chromate transporter [Candidatus Cryptobacteroides faecipullorum]
MASYLQIFSTFAKIGAFTIGGGYAMIPLIKDEIIRKGWMNEEDFPDIIALSQSAPGLLAVNISIFVGYRLRGTMGSIVATCGSITPPFLIILIIAMAFTGFQDHPVVIRIFQGIRPVVVALIAVPMLQMARKSNKTWWMWGMSIATILLVAFLNVSPIYILIVTIIVSYSLAKYRESRKREDTK